MATDAVPAEPLGSIPQRAQESAPLLEEMRAAFEASAAAKQAARRSCLEQEHLKARLASIDSERETLARLRQELEEQLIELERRQQERRAAFERELEHGLERELAQIRQQLAEESGADTARVVQAFEVRERERLQQALEEELTQQERELERLSRDVPAQADRLLAQLGQLEAQPELSRSIAHSAHEALASRRAALETRRTRLAEEREGLLAPRRAELLARLKQEQDVESQRRLALQEVKLREAMNALLLKTRLEEMGRFEGVRQALRDAKGSFSQLALQQALLTSRLEAVEEDLGLQRQQIDGLEMRRQVALAGLAQSLRLSSAHGPLATLTWFGKAIEPLPPELIEELGRLQQQVVAWAEEERRLQTQRRAEQQRQRALQIAGELTVQYDELRREQQREAQSRRLEAEQCLAQARQRAGRAQFDQALGLIAQAEALAPEWDEVALLRAQIVQVRERATRQARRAQAERMFTRGVKVFRQGDFEEAAQMFEQVLAHDERSEPPGPRGD